MGFDREGYAYFERWVGLKGEGSDTDKKCLIIPVYRYLIYIQQIRFIMCNTYVSEKYYVVIKKKGKGLYMIRVKFGHDDWTF